jgi:phosphoglycolate phosphatase
MSGLGPFPFAIVAFDLDGTLLNTAPDLSAAVNHMLAQLGRSRLDCGTVTKMIGRGMRVLMERALTATGPMTAALVEEALPIFLEYYEEDLTERTRPYPGAAEALNDLRARGVRLAICTNKPERLTRKLLNAFGWEAEFQAVVGGDSTVARKPNPTPLFAAIERAGGGRAVLVGDSINDTETAKAARLPCVAVSFGYRDRPAEALGATRLIDSYDDLLPVLLALGNDCRLSADSHSAAVQVSALSSEHFLDEDAAVEF